MRHTKRNKEHFYANRNQGETWRAFWERVNPPMREQHAGALIGEKASPEAMRIYQQYIAPRIPRR